MRLRFCMTRVPLTRVESRNTQCELYQQRIKIASSPGWRCVMSVRIPAETGYRGALPVLAETLQPSGRPRLAVFVSRSADPAFFPMLKAAEVSVGQVAERD